MKDIWDLNVNGVFNMSKKVFIDISIVCIAVAILVLCLTYMEQGDAKDYILIGGSILIPLFLLITLLDFFPPGYWKKGRKKGNTIQQLILLDEEGNRLSAWHIGGKVSVLIGRDTKKESVDINLQNTEYGGLVDCQHAVLNYAGGQWYVEDLGSTNGIRIEKKEDGKLYQVSGEHLCRLNTGDILHIANTRLQAE